MFCFAFQSGWWLMSGAGWPGGWVAGWLAGWVWQGFRFISLQINLLHLFVSRCFVVIQDIISDSSRCGFGSFLWYHSQATRASEDTTIYRAKSTRALENTSIYRTEATRALENISIYNTATTQVLENKGFCCTEATRALENAKPFEDARKHRKLENMKRSKKLVRDTGIGVTAL